MCAVGGVDGSAKRRPQPRPTFANALAQEVDATGRPALVVHEEDFLAPRATRYRQGRELVWMDEAGGVS